MTALLKLRVAIAIAIGALLIGGCSSSDSDPSADPSSQMSSSPTVSTTSTASNECQVDGYVPRSGIVLKRQHPVVVYAHGITLAPGSGMGSTALELGRLDLVPLKVRTDDRAVKLTQADRDQILASGGGPVDGGKIDDVVYGASRLKNTSDRNRSYMVYRGSSIYSGTWVKRVCGAPYNDGTSVDKITGTYSTVTKIGPVKVTACGVPASDSRVDRYAAHRACRDF